MSTLILTLLTLMLICSNAWASKFINLPICIDPQNPPMDALRIYENGKLTREIKSPWFASGGVRFSLWYESVDPTAVLVMRTVKSGVEGSNSVSRVMDDSSTTPCWQQPVINQDVHGGDFPSVREQALKIIGDFNLDGRVDWNDAYWFTETLKGNVQ